MYDRGEGFFHTYGRTAAVDVTGKRQKFLLRDHRHGFFFYRTRRFFQIEFGFHGYHKHIMRPARPYGNERFENFFGVQSQDRRHFRPRQSRLSVSVTMNFVRNFFCVQNPHCICFVLHIETPFPNFTLTKPLRQQDHRGFLPNGMYSFLSVDKKR